MARRCHDEACSAESVSEALRIQFEEESKVCDTISTRLAKLQSRYDQISTQLYSTHPTPLEHEDLSRAKDQALHDLEQAQAELISAYGEIKDLRRELREK